MKKILVIEDDDDIIFIVEQILKEDGYSVVTVSEEITGSEIAEISPNLIIIDYLLPFRFGDEICMEIKNHEPTKHIPVIIYSASLNLVKIVSRCKADGYITKPFDLEDFLNEVKKHLLE